MPVAKTMMAVSMAVAAAGAGVQAIGQYQQAKSEAQWHEYNAKVAEMNAIAAKQQAEYEEQKHRRETERILSRQRALYGKAGVRLEGSPLLVMEETAAEAEMDALAIRRGGYIQSERYKSEAGIERMKAQSTRRAGAYKAGTTLLTGTGDFASSYSTYKEKWG